VSVAAILGLVLALVIVDAAVTVRILRCEALTPGQQVAWLCFVWLVPLVGAIFGFQVSSDSRPPPRPDSSLDAEAPLTPGLHIAGSGYTGGGGPAATPADPSFHSDS